jgi:HSP20 family protein
MALENILIAHNFYIEVVIILIEEGVMNVTRYEPWSALNEVNSLFENMLQRRAGDYSNVETSQWMPAVDIKEETNRFVILADLPGVDKEQIEIGMENNILTLRGERNETHKEEKENFSRVERIKGSFYRRFTLPDTADSEKIQAKTRNGVLEILIPKKVKAQPRRINIEAHD